MFELLKNLCTLNGTSGDEKSVRDYIISEIDGFCDYKIDPLGNILFFKKGEKRAKNNVMLDAHTDEVGIIVTSITDDGYLRFKTVGGIEKEVMLFHRVIINNKTVGVIGNKPIHLCEGDEAKKLPSDSSLYIDIGAASREEALKVVSEGDCGVMCGDFSVSGDKILSKALDDRVGCAVLITLIKENSEYDFCGSFSVCEEVGCVGASCAAFTLEPDAAIVLEGTTAADVAGVPNDRTVCKSGNGVAVSFMDGGTVYNRELFDMALSSGILCQKKTATTGGNDAAAIHKSRGGVKTLGLSVPCRYIHSSGSVCDKADVKSMLELARYMISGAQEL